MKPLSLIARALDRLSPIAIGKKILIIEIGIIGQLWASVLRLQGHKNVSICNTNKKKPRPGNCKLLFTCLILSINL